MTAAPRETQPSPFDAFRREFLEAYRIRTVEDRLLRLFREGRVFGTVHTSIGQELAAVLVARHLRPQDVVFSNHRCHGHYIARTKDVRGLLAEVMGRAVGVCRGVGGSQHLCADGFFSNGIQGGIVPVSTGIALSHKMRGNGAISVAYLGDGTLGEGAVYEALNVASRWELPQLFVIEDNGYAQSTPSSLTLAGTVSGRAAAFDVAYHEANIWDPEGLDRAAREAIAGVRRGKPAVLHIEVYRLEAHSKGDDDRDRAEVEAYWARDPLSRFLDAKRDCQETTGALTSIANEVDAIVESLLDEAFPSLDSFGEVATMPPPRVQVVPVEPEPATQVQSINVALDRFLGAQPEGILIGEDILSPYGGAFKACRDLSHRHPTRVFTTPISEAAIVGIANGVALAGGRAVAEIMFGDFMTLAFDQILNHAAKFRHMYGTAKDVALVVRAPMGGGRGYGPTHSQCLEKHFVGIPGTHVFVLHGRCRVQRFYAKLLSESRTPSLVMEHKLLYGERGDRKLPPGYSLHETTDAHPTTILKPDEPPDLTIVAFGGATNLAEEVAGRLREREEIVAELVFPLQVYPLDAGAFLRSVSETRKLVVVEEGAQGFDLASEVIATVATQWTAPEPLTARRLAAKPVPIPCSKPLEKRVLPDVEELFALCMDAYRL